MMAFQLALNAETTRHSTIYEKERSEMDKEEFENTVKEYLMHHASLSIMHNQEGDCRMTVSVSLLLDNEEIANGSDTIFLL